MSLFWLFVGIGFIALLGKKFNWSFAGLKIPKINNDGIQTKKILYAIGGIGAAVFLWNLFELTKDDIRENWIAFLVCGAMVIGWLRSDITGTIVVGKVGFIILAIILIAELSPKFWNHYWYGSEAEEVAHANEKARIAEAKREAEDAVAEAEGRATKKKSGFSHESEKSGSAIPEAVTITAPKDQWSEPIIFVPGFRVDWNGLDFETQVRVIGNPKWLSIAEWEELSKQGALLQAARHRGIGKTTSVTHTYSRS